MAKKANKANKANKAKPSPPPNWTLEGLRQTYGSTGLLFTLLQGGIAAASAFIPDWMTTSATLRTAMAAGGIVGAVIAYFLTPKFWKSVAEAKRLRGTLRYLAALIPGILLSGGTLAILTPEVAQSSSFFEFIRETLLIAPILLNLIVALGTCLVVFSICSIIGMLSPYMKKGA